MAIHCLADFDELNLDQALAEQQLDFDSWTNLISDVEKKYPDDIDKLSLVYGAFLSEFPLCCGYWRKYASHKARLCSTEEVVEVYEQAVESASFSVDIWVDYCTFCISIFEDPFDICRLFRRGLSFIGKDYMCHALWDKYIEFEFSQKQWSSLAHIYIEALNFPTKKLHQYYDSFKKLVTIWKEEMGCQDDSIVKLQPETRLDEELTTKKIEVSCVIDDLLEPSTRSEALQKYLSIGEHLYQKASNLELKISCFERNIYRTYFHVKPLDDDQLENWHHYLDFVELNGDFDWAVKLYERCLIPCARYSEFWMRYVDYVESKGGREIANDALERATRIFLKNLPAIHIFDAGFKEQIGDSCGARTAFLQFDLHSESSFINHVMRRANMEKRLGNIVAACNVYKEALSIAAKKKFNNLPMLYIHFSRLQYMVTNSVDAARDILIDGIPHVANCKLLLEELINFARNHEGARQINILESIVVDVITPGSHVSRGLSSKDRLNISELYLEYIDLCGTIHDSRRAWSRHAKLFPHSLRVSSTCMQPTRASSGRIISTDGTHDTAFVNPIEVGRLNNMSPLIQLCCKADTIDNVKDLPDQDDTCKADEESRELVCAAADSDPMQDDKNYKVCSVEQEERHVSGQDEPPSLDLLSLNEPDDESHNLASSMVHGRKSRQETSPSNSGGILECAQNNELPSSSSVLNAQVNDSSQGYRESPIALSTLSAQSPQRSEDRKDQEWSLSPPHHGSPKRQSSRRYSEDQRRELSVSPQRYSSPLHSERKHHEDRFLRPQRRRSRWSSVEPQGEEPSHSPRRRLSPDGRGVQSYSGRHRQNRPMYYDNSRGQGGRRMQNERRGASTQARRAHNVHRQRFTSTSQMQPPAQPVGYFPGQMGQYPMQSSEQYAIVQNSQTYSQMWQYYYYQQQQQLLLLQQQSNPNLQLQQVQPPQLLPQPQSQQQLHPQPQTQQSQQQLQSQPNSMQLVQLQYQQLQLLYEQQLQLQQQQQQQQEEVLKQPQPQQQQQLNQQILQQQQQLNQQILQQQPQLNQQMLHQHPQQQQQQQCQQMQQQQPHQLQEQSYQPTQVQQQQHQMQTYQYQQQYLIYLQQLQQQPGGPLQAQLPQQQVPSSEPEEQKELQLQQNEQLPPRQHDHQDGDQVSHTEDKSASSPINS